MMFLKTQSNSEVGILPEILTPRLNVRLMNPHEALIMARFRVDNRQHLAPWEPKRQPEFFTEAFWHIQLMATLKAFQSGNSICFTIFERENQEEVLGVCNYTNIVRGTFQSCHLGYALSESHQGKGIMSEALEYTIPYIFQQIGLHRIMANYLPHNERSAGLLNRLGFEIEGKAKEYLLINGKWEDHILTSLVNSR